jgi:hypothetical protein
MLNTELVQDGYQILVEITTNFLKKYGYGETIWFIIKVSIFLWSIIDQAHPDFHIDYSSSNAYGILRV